MEYLILIGALIVVALPITLVLRKSAYKKLNSEINNFLMKRGTSLEQELQIFIDSQNMNLKVVSVSADRSFRYKNKELICIAVKFKVEGQNESYLGIVSDSGSYTEFGESNVLTNYNLANVLLQKIYKQPKKEINEGCFVYLPKLENIYNFNIESDEKVIFNSIVLNFQTDYDISIGINAKVTMTDKKIYVYNGAGLWTIDIYNDIADYRVNDNCIDIDLTEICFFGANNERICTGFKFYLNKEDLDRFKNILDNVIM